MGDLDHDDPKTYCASRDGPGGGEERREEGRGDRELGMDEDGRALGFEGDYEEEQEEEDWMLEDENGVSSWRREDEEEEDRCEGPSR